MARVTVASDERAIGNAVNLASTSPWPPAVAARGRQPAASQVAASIAALTFIYLEGRGSPGAGMPNGVDLPAAGGYVGGQAGEDAETPARLRRRARTGRPPGAPALPDRLESLLGRTLRPHKQGPKPQGGKR